MTNLNYLLRRDVAAELAAFMRETATDFEKTVDVPASVVLRAIATRFEEIAFDSVPTSKTQ